MKRAVWAVAAAAVVAGAYSMLLPGTGQALSLRVQPLSYRTALNPKDKKKGFIDIHNPTGQQLRLQTSVQGFRQVNDQGELEFFESEQLQAGIVPDFSEFTLRPGQTMRMVFLLDGSKLPRGDVFAALFVGTQPQAQAAGASAVRVGTLLMLTNGPAPPHTADVTGLKVPWLQWGSIGGSYRLRNTSNAQQSQGFVPTVTVAVWPWRTAQPHTGRLVFAGRERWSEFRQPTHRLGLYMMEVGYGASRQRQIVFVVSWVGLAVCFGVAVAGAVLVRWRVKRRTAPQRQRGADQAVPSSSPKTAPHAPRRQPRGYKVIR